MHLFSWYTLHRVKHNTVNSPFYRAASNPYRIYDIFETALDTRCKRCFCGNTSLVSTPGSFSKPYYDNCRRAGGALKRASYNASEGSEKICSLRKGCSTSNNYPWLKLLLLSTCSSWIHLWNLTSFTPEVPRTHLNLLIIVIHKFNIGNFWF